MMSGVALASIAAVILGRNSLSGTMEIWRSTLFFFAHSWAKLARASSLDFRHWYHHETSFGYYANAGAANGKTAAAPAPSAVDLRNWRRDVRTQLTGTVTALIRSSLPGWC